MGVDQVTGLQVLSQLLCLPGSSLELLASGWDGMQSFHLEVLVEMAWLRISESLGSWSGLE